MKACILVPVKDQGKAKLRLAPVFRAEERARLALAMFDDLVRALEPFTCLVVLVTNSELAAKQVCRLGWRVFWEDSQISESASVDAASQQLVQEGAKAVLRVPADLPLLRSTDIEELLELPLAYRMTALVPSWDRTGTNAILRAPPNLFPSRFGHNSFILHTHEAMRVQARIEIRENPRLALDLDDVSDVARFLERKSDTETYRLLLELNAKERIG